MTKIAALSALFVLAPIGRAASELTVYQLLAPSTHAFDIVYDVTVTREGSAYFFNPIRPGSTASKERARSTKRRESRWRSQPSRGAMPRRPPAWTQAPQTMLSFFA